MLQHLYRRWRKRGVDRLSRLNEAERRAIGRYHNRASLTSPGQSAPPPRIYERDR